MPEYVFDNAAVQTEDRFQVLEAVYDKVSTERLAALGVAPGWRCLEVGGGGGSMAHWLAGRVGPEGHVLATDINPSRMGRAGDTVEVRQHDIVTDELPAGAFDLVHARLVLIHLPGRLQALRRIYDALKPGGLLVLDEFDCSYLPPLVTRDEASAALYTKATRAIHQLIDDLGGDPDWGRHALGALRETGFTGTAHRAYCESWTGGSDGARLHRANAVQVHDNLVGKGLLTEDEYQRFLALLDDPELVINSYLMYTIWGRKPADG